jgi:hypothetical protein
MEILFAIPIWLSLIGYSVNVRMRHEWSHVIDGMITSNQQAEWFSYDCSRITFGHHREIRDDDKALAPSEHMYTPCWQAGEA